jgi:phage major head subunit gpT-like protein
MQISRANLAALRVGFQAIYAQGLQSVSADWLSIAMETTSSSAKEAYGWLGTSTRFREWVGPRVLQNLQEHDFEIKNRAFENSIGVDRDNIEDDKLGIYTPMLQQLGMDAGQHPNELVFDVLNRAHQIACYDGQYFFDTDHPVVDESGATKSVSNYGGGSGALWVLYDASKVLKPVIFQRRRDYTFVAMDAANDEQVFADKTYRYGVDARVGCGVGMWQLAYGSRQTLDADSYTAARTALASVTGDQGKKLAIMGTKLLVGPSNEAAAREVLLAERNNAGATNVWRNTAELIVTPWLT